MAAAMKASVVLNLEDQLTGGLNKLLQQFEKLKSIGQQLGLGRLTNAFGEIERGIGVTRGLVNAVHAVGTAADTAWTKLRRVASAVRGALGGGMMGGGIMGALGAGITAASILMPARAYANYEAIARSAAINERLSGPAAGAESLRLQTLWNRDALATGQSSTTIGNAYLEMVGMGIAPAEAQRLLPIHSRVATAYGIDPGTLTPATVALEQSFGIKSEDMGGALAAMARASMEGRFKLEDFARFMPGIGGYMNKLGIGGRQGADEAFAALETVMRYSPDPGSGAANFMDFMNYLTAHGASRSFALQSKGMGAPDRRLLEQYHIRGIDLPAVLADARKKGIDPITAVTRVLGQEIKGLPKDVASRILGLMLGNQQAGTGAYALVHNAAAFHAMEKQLGAIHSDILDKGFQTRMESAQIQVRLLDEEWAQLNRRIGVGFMPVVKAAVYGLDDINSGVRWLDSKFPGLGDDVLGATGALLGLSAVLGALAFALPIVGSGIRMFLITPLRLLASGVVWIVGWLAALSTAALAWTAVILLAVGAIAIAAYEIYEHWDQVSAFFSRMWAQVKVYFGEFTAWVEGWASGPVTAAIARIQAAWGVLRQWFAALWADIRRPFDEFISYVESSSIGHLLHLDAPQLATPGGGAAPKQGAETNLFGWSMPPPAHVNVTVGVDPNNGHINITHTSTDSAVTTLFGGPNPGPTAGRP